MCYGDMLGRRPPRSGTSGPAGFGGRGRVPGKCSSGSRLARRSCTYSATATITLKSAMNGAISSKKSTRSIVRACNARDGGAP